MTKDELRVDKRLREASSVEEQIQVLQNLCDNLHGDDESVSRDMLETVAVFPRVVTVLSLLHEELCEYQILQTREAFARTVHGLLCGKGERDVKC